MDIDEQKTMVVRDLMMGAFPDSEVVIDDDVAAGFQVFSARLKGLVYTAMVTHDFLKHHKASEIPDKIRAFLLFEHLKDMPGTPFVVTRNGLELHH